MSTSITITKVNPTMCQNIIDFIDEYCYDITDCGDLRVMAHVTPMFLVEEISNLFKKYSFSKDAFAITSDILSEHSSLISIAWWEFNKVQLMTILWEDE